MTDPHDELDELLAPRSAAEPSTEFRAALLRRTGRQLARVRWARRVRVLVAAAAVFACGVAVGSSLKPIPPLPLDLGPFRVVPPEVVVVPVVVPVPAGPPPVAPSPEAPLTAGQLELRAELADDPAEAARLYRLAGDRYLNDLEDYRNAARCYRLFLARAGDGGLSPVPGDTWLLTSLKNAAFKEKYDAANRDGYALFGLVLVALTATGQPPAGADKKAAEKSAAKADPAKQADPAEAAIAAALAHDPDVRMARAKVQLAEAELAKARQQVAVKVITLRATIEEQKQAVALAQEAYALTERVVKTGQAPVSELNQARAKLEVARSALARAEMELKLLTDGGPGGVGAAGDPIRFLGKPGNPDAAIGVTWLADQQFYQWTVGVPVTAARGAVPDRIRAALNKKVTLGPKGEKVPLQKALEVFKKDAGWDVPVRVKYAEKTPPAPLDDDIKLHVTSEGEELPVGAWLQLYQDSTSGALAFYVREYGLLLTTRANAPPDALTLTQFWDLKPPAKTGKDEKKE